MSGQERPIVPDNEQLLEEPALSDALATLEGWERDGASITKRYRFKGFKSAIAFVDRVAEVVNKANHHPDIHVEHYKHVRIVLTTHKVKGLSQADIDVARAIDGVAETGP
ncbi:MAG TPA: 4a-hydroxytetrahydrobiopterin dehydratase [Candidatus Limnocylindria bacterium]|nr:4a-hydroxytetrahydrobiopterin dehydratase [Candidatus Limnocylindria bacterium]